MVLGNKVMSWRGVSWNKVENIRITLEKTVFEVFSKYIYISIYAFSSPLNHANSDGLAVAHQETGHSRG